MADKRRTPSQSDEPDLSEPAQPLPLISQPVERIPSIAGGISALANT